MVNVDMNCMCVANRIQKQKENFDMIFIGVIENKKGIYSKKLKWTYCYD